MNAASTFLRNCPRRKTLNRRRSSYGWKHVAERAVGEYVSNEELIAEALALGFKIRRIPNTPNCWLNISERAAKHGGRG